MKGNIEYDVDIQSDYDIILFVSPYGWVQNKINNLYPHCYWLKKFQAFIYEFLIVKSLKNSGVKLFLAKH